MAKASGRIRNSSSSRDWYSESRRLRDEAIAMSEILRNNPVHAHISNGIEINLTITKSDIKTIVSKNTKDNKFNAIKNKLAQDIVGFINKATYIGWRETIAGKHPESAYFVYYERRSAAYLCVRRMKETGEYKPYAIINKQMFDAEIGNLHKGKPPL